MKPSILIASPWQLPTLLLEIFDESFGSIWSGAIGPDIVRFKRVAFWPRAMGVPWHKNFVKNWYIGAAVWCEACQAGEILEQQEEGKTAADFKLYCKTQ